MQLIHADSSFTKSEAMWHGAVMEMHSLLVFWPNAHDEAAVIWI